MRISPFFRNLRSAYLAELDDLRFDTDGKDVLARRLAQRRRELAFLVSMLEASPEMVAVVLHQGFTFTAPAVMEQVVAHDAQTLPTWDSLLPALQLAPWTQELVALLRQQPKGEWFLVVACALEYLCAKSERLHATPTPQPEADGDDGSEDRDHETGEPEDDEEREARAHEEASADWLAEQGFDRRDHNT